MSPPTPAEDPQPVDVTASPPLVGEASRLRLRDSLGARISALLVLVLLATAISAFVAVTQLRALARGIDRLVEVHVVLNQSLAEAHVQAQRVGVQVQNWQDKEGEESPTFEANFRAALTARNDRIDASLALVEQALATTEPVGAGASVEELRGIAASLQQLRNLAALDEIVDAHAVLQDVRTQNQIESLFKQVARQSNRAVEQLRAEMQVAQERSEWLTVLLALVVGALGVLAALGVFLTLRPLRRLSEGVRKLSGGDWSQRVSDPDSAREDEVHQLAREFDHMAAALEERERRLLRGERLAAAGQLAAQITHEIRNPLSSVALNAELLEDELSEASPESRELLARISKEVDRLTAVTEDYLSFARRPKPQVHPIDLRQELADLLEFMAQELELAGVEVVRRLPDEPVAVVGDPNQLRQVFMNLLRNAQEATLGDEGSQPERQPRIEVEMQCKDDEVRVVFGDNGPGIDGGAEAVEQIFQAFYTSKAQGTGLGLPTVQQIVQDHDGTVAVAQTGPAGTTFEVRLPACDKNRVSVSSPAAIL